MFSGSVKIDEKGKKKNFTDSDGSPLRSGNSKASQGASSKPVLSRLPKMVSIITGCHMAPLSPGRDYGCRHNRPGGFRCHTYLIPKEAMEKKDDRGFEPLEPTSPKVSCIGQVKKKKQALEAKQRWRRSQDRPRLLSQTRPLITRRGPKFSKMKSFFSGKKVTESAFCESPEIDVTNCPSLGQMKRFSSGRRCDALENVCRDSQKLTEKCSDEKIDANLSPVMFYSGPLINERPKTEINLWKRRSIAPPMALNLSASHGLETRIPLTT
ncbi:hypothetical protein SUGI_0638980 [Cryptomeria japonica]|uniref:uncharacterized protein At1g76070 n=1 Tax=Cryptomeria japonica TaxID=3369 RepID=UPI0024146AEE|nr:uncharacterized protein At1g76070 [Cryptomeria japonica]GLJ31765.1 hypothetical protein SUGI_0638980 [Cryptomeria japonica]